MRTGRPPRRANQNGVGTCRFIARIASLAFAALIATTVNAYAGTPLVHYAVSTQSAQAQTLFDEGLTMIYAFNREEAQKRFTAAAKADPSLAIAWWGVALAAGPNLNIDMTDADWKTARDAVARAKALASTASPEERRLIEAIAARYPAQGSEPASDAYRDAMARVHADFPMDDDVTTLYVESAMDADDWGFAPDATPIGKTAELNALLAGVIARRPAHPGANHYFMHLNDFQSTASRALTAANTLSSLPIEPAASHLKHMSGHIYFDLGMFAGVQRDNRVAVDDDRRFAADTGRKPDSLDYYFHNLDFYTGGSLMLGDQAEAERGIAMFKESNNPNAMFALNRLGRFDDALAIIPKAKSGASESWLTRWHYARGIALVSKGRIDAAQAELDAFPTYPRSAPSYLKNQQSALARLLDARITFARGNAPAAQAELRALIAQVAAIPPEAFPSWYFPSGEWLGWMLIQSGDGAGAEAAFRADLARTPHNPRALYGLMQALSAQGRTPAGDAYALEIARTWRGPTSGLRDQL